MKKFHRLPWKSWISSVYVLQIVCHVTAMSKIFFHHIIKLRICKNNHALYFGDLRNVTSQLPNFIFNWRIQVLEELSCQRYPSGIYLFKFNIGNTKTRSEICSKLTIKISERRHWRRSGFFIGNRFHTLLCCFHC